MKLFRNCFLFFLAFLSLSLLGHQAYAMEFQNGDSVTIPKDKVINGSLFISGNSVIVDGEINGDVFCVGKDVVITGTVHGDVLCAGKTLHINNNTDGNIRVAGQTVDISGTAGANATVFGQTVTESENGAIDGELLVAGQNVKIDGYVGRDVQAWLDAITITGQIDGSLGADTNSLSIADGAIIGGNVNYTSDQNATIASGATVGGKVSKHTDTQPVAKPAPVVSQNHSGNWGFLITTLIFGAILLQLFPGNLLKTVEAMQERWGKTIGLGVLVVILSPLFILFLIVTLVGIPLAIAAVGLFIAAYFIGRILVALLVGRIILDSVYKQKKDSLGWNLVAGSLVLWATFLIPVVGGIVSFIVTIFGFGGVLLLFQLKKKQKS